ncbi:MAG: lipopolysaccharide heptosyltransferase II [Deltaproteobacteria bacterium]|nr:lipopolysaccharide heptosyltransferase II [Deltaproteobacteria bacterium]
MVKEDGFKKVLVRAPNWIGDAVLAIPALAAFKTAFPQVSITILARTNTLPVFERCAAVSSVIAYDKNGSQRGVMGMVRLASMLRAGGFDLALLFQNAFEAALLAWLARIPQRIGYARDSRSWLLTKAVKAPYPQRKDHQVFHYLNLVKEIGANVPLDPIPELSTTREEDASAERFLKDNDVAEDAFLVGVFPGASYGPAKKWPPEYFKSLIERFSARENAVALVFGGRDDMETAGLIVKDINARYLDLAGSIGLAEFMALAKRLRVFITNDSGPMHLAASLGVPTVAIFGSTSPSHTAPLGPKTKVLYAGTECSPCFERTCRYNHYRCLKDISPEEVYSAASELIKEAGIAVFLDRDGTINEDSGYVGSPDKVVLIQGAGDAIKRLNDMGLKVIVITNQSAVGRGYFTECDVMAVNKRISGLIAESGAHIDGFYWCPHLPEEDCGCRKPKPGMLKRAALDHKIELKGSYLAGDKVCDIETAAGVGAKGVLVLTGYGEKARALLSVEPHHIAQDLSRAVDWIVRDSALKAFL